MKIITRTPYRRLGKSVVIFPDLSIDPNMTVKELFGPSGHIRVSVERIVDNQVELGFIAPAAISVLKEEAIEPVANVLEVDEITIAS